MSNKRRSEVERAKRQVGIRKAYQSVFSGPMGRQVLMDLIKQSKMMSNPPDLSNATLAFAEGERSIVRRILSYVHTDTTVMSERIEEYAKAIELGE